MSLHARSEDSPPSVRKAILASNTDVTEKGSMVQNSRSPPTTEVTCFATHGSFGVVDLGATKTVIGSSLVPDLINSLSPEVRKSLSRCSCSITFRFGNQGVLQSTQALVIPIRGFLLKVAIVPGSTPFLLSNTLLRALEAVIDTAQQKLVARKIHRTIPLQLTAKGLFLLDINDLAEPCHDGALVETHVVSDAKGEEAPPVSQGDRSNRKPGISNDKPGATVVTKETPKISNEIEGHTTAESMCDESSNLCPKSIAKGFVVPVKLVDHGQSVSTTSEGAEHSRTAHARSESVQPASDGRLPDRFWKGSLWSNLPGCMADRPTLDQMVCGPFPKFKHYQTQDVSPLCEPPSGESGVGRRVSGTHSRDQRALPEGRYWGQWEVLPKGTTKSQGNGSGGQVLTRSDHGPRGVASGPGRFHVGATRTGSGISRHSASEISNAEHGECVDQSHCPLGKDHGQHGQQQPQRGQVRDHQIECSTLLSAGDICSDADTFEVESVERNREGKYFQHMIQKIHTELQEVLSESLPIDNSRYHLFEVFCGPQSQLTHQCTAVGLSERSFWICSV